VDTWVFLLAAFAVFSAFYACTTAKKRFVKLLMGSSAFCSATRTKIQLESI